MKSIYDIVNEAIVKHNVTKKKTTKTEFPVNLWDLSHLMIKSFKEGVYNLNFIDTSKIKDMAMLFGMLPNDIQENLDKLDISEWDVSNVITMNSMFQGCKKFNCDLTTWDVSNVTNMGHMFSGCEKFNSNLKYWDVSNVKDLKGMFENCKEFNQDISNWKINDDAKITNIFKGCDKLDYPDWYYANIYK